MVETVINAKVTIQILLCLSSAHWTAIEPMNIAERLFGKFMNWTALVNKTTTVSNRELCPKSPFFMN